MNQIIHAHEDLLPQNQYALFSFLIIRIVMDPSFSMGMYFVLDELCISIIGRIVIVNLKIVALKSIGFYLFYLFLKILIKNKYKI